MINGLLLPIKFKENPGLAKLYINLGNWSESEWQNSENTTTLPYYVKRVADLEEQFNYTESLVKNILNQIQTKNLGLKHGKQYYEILFGPWLRSFTAVVLDRYMSIKHAKSIYPNFNFLIINYSECINRSCNSSNEYLEQIKTDQYNNNIFKDLLNELNINYIVKNITIKKDEKNKIEKKITFKDLINKYNRLLVKLYKSKFLFYRPYINKVDSIKAQLHLFQIPSFHIEKILLEKDLNCSPELNLINENSSGNEIERILYKLIYIYMPKSLRINSNYFESKFNEIGFPKAPKLIFTSNSLEADDLFKHYAALKTNEGVKIITHQHGGLYGQGKFLYNESNDINSSNNFISWGWRIDNIITKGFGIKPNKIRKNKIHSNVVLLVISGSSRYYNGHLSVPLSNFYVDYLDDQIKFINQFNALKNGMNLRVRLYVNDLGWNVKDKILSSCCSSVEFSEPNKSFEKDVESAELVIHGWCSTTYLQTMAMNIPTILWFNNDLFPIRNEAREDFVKLKNNSIFHENLDSLIHFLINNNIEKWWKSNSIEKIKSQHLIKYCNTNWTASDLSKILKVLSF